MFADAISDLVLWCDFWLEDLLPALFESSSRRAFLDEEGVPFAFDGFPFAAFTAHVQVGKLMFCHVLFHFLEHCHRSLLSCCWVVGGITCVDLASSADVPIRHAVIPFGINADVIACNLFAAIPEGEVQ